MENLPPSVDTDDTYMKSLYRCYYQKRAELENEVVMLRELRHPHYIVEIKMLEEKFSAELEREEIANQLENERIQERYEREKKAAEKELEERLTELMETMIQECEELRKKIEHEFHNSEISSAPGSDYPNKKSLRRRPNEPTPYNEKQAQSKSQLSIPDSLTEQEIQQDLLLLDEAERRRP
ncbi:unnamed protein product [Thelazia callipaeda]|uniref:Sin3 histone deacetylase corepressor complex component sds3 n=1 Tax=Thelazia callipaeda TaxID=103827 RepID=A0A0N5D7K4_THECL|nr:unnamed protein product [Thelazia callipaeda]